MASLIQNTFCFMAKRQWSMIYSAPLILRRLYLIYSEQCHVVQYMFNHNHSFHSFITHSGAFPSHFIRVYLLLSLEVWIPLKQYCSSESRNSRWLISPLSVLTADWCLACAMNRRAELDLHLKELVDQASWPASQSRPWWVVFWRLVYKSLSWALRLRYSLC